VAFCREPTTGQRVPGEHDHHQQAGDGAERLDADVRQSLDDHPRSGTRVFVSHVGNQYVIQPASLGQHDRARGSVNFGFLATPGGSPGQPSNVLLNGVAV